MPTNKYTNATTELGSRVLPGLGAPGRVLALVGTYEKTASDNDASVLRIGRIPANAVPLVPLSFLNNDALTGATDIDIGVYKPSALGGVDGAVVDKDILTDGINIAAGNALASPIKAFQAIAIENFGKSVKELVDAAAGTTSQAEEYDVAITGNTFGTAAGTITWSLLFLLPQQ